MKNSPNFHYMAEYFLTISNGWKAASFTAFVILNPKSNALLFVKSIAKSITLADAGVKGLRVK